MLRKLITQNFEISLDRPLVMGVLNVTPDSFSDGGLFMTTDAAIAHARKMIDDGADIIDIGGESTRPGAHPLSVDEELSRVLPIVDALTPHAHIPLSIDTTKPEVAEECLRHGADIINDVSGLADDRMIEIAARSDAPVVIMHMQGTPQTMQQHPHYIDVVGEVAAYLARQAMRARQRGVNQIIIDPGVGFGKTVDHNLTIINRLEEFTRLGYPVLVGLSRKKFIGAILGREVNERLAGTLAAVTACILHGADIMRVHDVKECRDAMILACAIKEASQ